MARTTDERPGRTIRSVQIAFNIIDVLQEKGGAGVTELADELGHSKSTIHSHLRTLEERNILVREGDGYRLSLRILDMATHVREQVGNYDVIRDEVDELASKFSGAQLIERATRLNMGREFQRILGWCKGEPEALLGHYLERYTIYNLKALLRGAQAGAGREETESALIPAGVTPMATWSSALSASTLTECIEALPSMAPMI
jgi:DNA-binding MarR family transcriptional regulator